MRSSITGGVPKTELRSENIEALIKGLENLKAHIANIKRYHVPVVVAVNRFSEDTEKELMIIENACAELGVECASSSVFEQGGDGGVVLAEKVINASNNVDSGFKLLYPDEMPIIQKIEEIAKVIYGADGVDFSPAARKSISEIESMGFGAFPVCIAKTQYSLSDNPRLLGRPSGFRITVRQIKLSAGAGFVVALCGDIMTMPGLPATPAAEGIDIDENSRINGIF